MQQPAPPPRPRRRRRPPPRPTPRRSSPPRANPPRSRLATRTRPTRPSPWPGSTASRSTVLGPSLATGRIVKTAQADIQTGQWLVSLEMRGGEDGIDTFNEIAAKCYQGSPDPAVCPTGRLAVVLDSVVQSAPSITEPTYTADQIPISGDFTESEAKDLALVLRYGSLPVELERADRADRVGHPGRGLPAGRPGRRHRRPRPRGALHDPLLPGARPRRRVRPRRVGRAHVHGHLLAGGVPGPGPHARGRDRHDHVDRRDGRLVRRVLRTVERRRTGGPDVCAARPSARSNGPSARSWRPT